MAGPIHFRTSLQTQQSLNPPTTLLCCRHKHWRQLRRTTNSLCTAGRPRRGQRTQWSSCPRSPQLQPRPLPPNAKSRAGVAARQAQTRRDMPRPAQPQWQRFRLHPERLTTAHQKRQLQGSARPALFKTAEQQPRLQAEPRRRSPWRLLPQLGHQPTPQKSHPRHVLLAPLTRCLQRPLLPVLTTLWLIRRHTG